MKPVFFIDLDGVLADFIGGVLRRFNRESPWWDSNNHGSYDVCKLLGIPVNEFWESLKGKEFWTGLDVLPDGLAMLRMLEEEFDDGDLFLLTSPTLDPYSAAGKMEWVSTHLPRYRRRLIIGASKEACASSNKILIDDSANNCSKFTRAGGHSILWPQLWNSAYANITSKDAHFGSKLSGILDSIYIK